VVDKRPGRSARGSDYARFLGIGFFFLVILIVCGGGGLLLDGVLGTVPLFLLLGLLIGFAGGLYYLYRALETYGR
jgi:hypothetical protein